ncbi:MAG TPA: LamG-like jellyroll fold domain-containing protein [Vicinamibacterales bacterium]|nr:LamG-like jellyroll fold domain-containing protein [Vicinamibacterales bacterium]
MRARSIALVGAVVAMSAVAVPAPVAAQSGLVAAYGFDAGSGTTVVDASGNGNTGVISGAVWTSGKFGGGLAFDGASSWVTIADSASLHLTTGMTLEAWVMTPAPNDWRAVILKERSGGLAYALYASDTSGRPSGYIHRSDDIGATSSSVLPAGTWVHLATTYDGATLRTYVDGLQTGSRSVTGSIIASTQALRVGGDSIWGEYFQGTIDELRVYNRALSAAEIQTDMNTPVSGGSEPPPTFSITGSVAPAASGSGSTVTLTGPANAAVAANASGQFTFSGLTNGTYTVAATKSGFSISPASQSVTVRDAGVTGVAFTATALNTGPSITLTAPVTGTTVSGTVVVSANASADPGVAGVQFQVDGVNLGNEITAPPYSMPWNTTNVPDGTHTVRGIVRDTAGETATSLTSTVTVHNSVTAPPAGLVAAYGFDEGSGTTAADRSGLGNTGVISGAAWTTGKFGGGLSFDGVSNWVTINDAASLALTTGMTLEAWVMTPAPTDWRAVVLKERPGDLAYALYASDTGGRPGGYISDTGATSASVLPANTWVHLATTYDGATLRTYVNGVQTGSRALTGSIIVSAQPLRIGGDSIWGEYFDGEIDEVRVYNRALTAPEIQADMITPVSGGGSGGAGDSTPPTVALTAPAAGATVSGSITLSATASDDRGVAGVSFQVDGANVGVQIPTAPYSLSWNSGTVPNGSHTIRALAVDAAGNTGTSPAQAITVNNTTDPAVVGQWASPFDVGMVAVNTVLMHTGKVLMFSGSFEVSYAARVWDPVTGSIAVLPDPAYNIFCAGQAQLPDGRILVVGGHDASSTGSAGATIFDPVTQTWSAVPDMAYRRWYPTATALPDGRMLVTSGGQTCLSCLADVPEIFDPKANRFSKLTSAKLAIWYYPFMFVLPDGRVLSAGSNEQAYETRALDLTSGTWSMVDPVIRDGHTAVMYRPGKILKTGTAADSGTSGSAAATAFVIDMTQPSPQWRQVASMHFPRAFQNSTILPDGNVLITGGGTQLDGYDVSKAVLTAELWSPATETFQTLSDAAVARLYHSTALLLPDGRILLAGSGDDGPAINQTHAELYSPPYLFKGPRPTITSAPDVLQYGAPFTVQTPDAASIESIALMRPGAVTHAFDEDQRYVELSFTAGAGSLTVQAPANANLAPPGYYMLFLVSDTGVPSVASWMHFPAPSADTQPPSAPTNLLGQGGLGTASMSWTASTDNTQVAIYDVYRSTVSGFVPSVANRVGQSVTTSFNGSGIAAGTYYYVVTAQDVAGNISAPSNELTIVVTADTAAPSVAITSPQDQSTVSGAITLVASAADNVGVAGVQFQIDGSAFGAELTSPPYSLAWNTSAAANGPHVIAVVARDATGNHGQASVTVNVSNTAGPPSGLVAAFGFNEGAGTTVSDGSGFGNTGTIRGAAWSASGHTGAALSFDGATSWVTVADAPALRLTTGMTIEAWVRPTLGTGWRCVLQKESADGLAYSLYSANDASRPGGWVHNDNDVFVLGTAAVALNTWTHLAVTYDGSALRFYTNGVLVRTATGIASIASTTGALRIGGDSAWGEYFQGLLDDVRVYNRALSAAEIQTDMNTGVQ